MFNDYYKILEISFGANAEDIKTAYKRQAMKWHPDKNPNQDVTSIMQDINEAYNILKNPVAKQRYDREYAIYVNETYKRSNDYQVHDEDLKNDIYTARKDASEYVKGFMDELKKQTLIAGNAAWNAAKGYVYALIIFTIIGNYFINFIETAKVMQNEKGEESVSIERMTEEP